jgi:hypothetical protein
MPADPIHYATYFDRHYLTRGLALYRSLERHSPPFVLWVLCLDDETQRTLSRLRLEQVELIPLAELERADPALLTVKPTRQPVEYYWTSGPAFLAYLFDCQAEIELLTYLDADLFFFRDPLPLYRELAGGSILIIEHRYSHRVPNEISARVWGIYNVGFLAFRRSPVGLACLRLWREQCLDWCFYRHEPGRCADQMYLDGWPERFEGVVTARHKGAGLAPWNLDNHRPSFGSGGAWVDEDPLIFYHFSWLRVINRWLYDPGLWRFCATMGPTVKRSIYGPYARELRTAGDSIRAVGGRVQPVDNLLHGRNRLLSLARMVRHGSFLVVTDRFAL